MLKFLLLALIPIVLSQGTLDPCSLRPCEVGQVCLRRDIPNQFSCLDESLLQNLVSKLPNQQTSRVAKPMQVPFQRVGVQQVQSLPVGRTSILPTTDRQPVMTPQNQTVVQSGLGNLRRGNFVQNTRRVVTPVEQPVRPAVQPVQTLRGQQPVQTLRVQQPVQTLRVPNGQFNRDFGFARQSSSDLTPTTTTTTDTVSLPDLCRGLNSGDQLPYPFDNSKFIICSPPGGSPTILSCPPGLRFNVYRNRCDYSDAEPAPACSTNPCKNSGLCTDLPNYEFQCQCTQGFEGTRCEKLQDACSTNPCGARGICRTFGFETGSTSYYCLCDNSRYYGLDCERNVAQNPCLMTTEDTYFPVTFSPSIFIHCYDNTIHLKACTPPLVWSQDIHACDRPTF